MSADALYEASTKMSFRQITIEDMLTRTGVTDDPALPAYHLSIHRQSKGCNQYKTTVVLPLIHFCTEYKTTAVLPIDDVITARPVGVTCQFKVGVK
eukprot:6191989-Pleurochrysis_carterae.AAC.2